MTTRHPPRRALVTGVSRGIGRAIAVRLLEDHWEVHGTFRSSRGPAETLSQEFSNLTLHRVDLADADAIEHLTGALDGQPLDGLVNNAGIIDFEDMDSFDLQSWRCTLEVNLTAPVRLARALEQQLKGGAIVNVASTDALIGSFASISYGVSKAGLLNATKSLGNLLARSDIRVNAVSPGWIDTDMTTEAALAARLSPMARNGTPEEVANVVAWLLGREASFMTGASVVVDGGYTNVDYVMITEAKGEVPDGG
jgi:NAD(P)-dependent dehydrogenase (short-subunit alcohol dehydrogenase family)